MLDMFACSKCEGKHAHRSKRSSYPVSEWCGELNPAFGMLDAYFPDRDGRDPQTVSLAGLIQLLDACVRQPFGVSFRVPEPDMGIEEQGTHFLRDGLAGRFLPA